MYIYNTLSKIPLIRKRFSSKFLFLAFLGIHVPLVSLIIYMLFDSVYPVSLIRVSVLILLFTVGSTIATLILLNKLMEPLVVAKKSLDNYLVDGKIPELPTHHTDEVGLLLKHIQSTTERLDMLLTEKSDMVDLLSHDLRSPLSRIIALSHLIDLDKEDNKSADVSEYTKMIVDESQNLLMLLEDVLIMLRKAGDNEITFHLTPTSLRSFMEKTISYFELAAQQKKVKYHINIEEGLIVNIEPVMFSQALKNLIGNALKYSDEGKNIYITSIAESKKLLVTIKDEGIGFDPKNKDKIFERFTRANKQGTKGESTTGLGLSLAKKIIEKHGGQLQANSEGVGRGATFTIILPRNNARTHAKGFKLIKVNNPFKKAI